MKTYSGFYDGGTMLFEKVTAMELYDQLPAGARLTGGSTEEYKSQDGTMKKLNKANYLCHGRKIIVREDP